MTIRLKITLLLTLSILVIAIGVFFSVRNTSMKLAEEQFVIDGNSQLDRVYDLVHLFLQTGGQVSTSLSKIPEKNQVLGNLSNYTKTTQPSNPDIASFNPTEQGVLKHLEAARSLLPAVEISLFGTIDGGYIKSPARSFGAGYDPRTRPWYKGAMDSNQPFFITDPYISSSTKTLVTTVSSKVKTETGQVIGVVGVDFVLSALTDILQEATVGKTGYLLLFDKAGRIMLDPKNKSNLMKTAAESGDAALALLAAQESGLYKVQRQGINYIALSRIFPDTGWKAAMIMEESEELASSTQLISSIAIILAILALVILGSGVFLSGSITKALVHLMEEVKSVAEGNFSALENNTKCGSEIYALRKDIKLMVGRIQELIHISDAKAKEAELLSLQAQNSFQEAEQARKTAENSLRQGRLDAATELEGITEKVFSSSTYLSTQVANSEQTVGITSERIAKTAMAMKEMNSTVLEVAQGAEIAAKMSNDAKVKAEQGAEIVKNVVQCINEVEKQSVQLKEDMVQLGNQANSIGTIMNVISDIADQTNLLALNAAIEAARAGVTGRGFAVVADEVRKLAEKTMQATIEVDKAIKGMQQSADKNKQGVELSSTIINKATELARQAGDSLKEIVGMVEASADQVHTIATASEEQSASSEEINGSLCTINNAAANTATAMAEAAKAVAELSTQSKSLARLIESMKRG